MGQVHTGPGHTEVGVSGLFLQTRCGMLDLRFPLPKCS